ncbi:MAG: hypothetical protein HY907_01345 [Deltaproteobacteria bacterium]|nr:hypothetical protein [Deltaproteobacteria bacterium]
MEGILQLVELVSGKVSEFSKSDVVVGEPVVAGNVTLVTLSRVGVGFGGGGGEGEGDFADGHPHHGHGPGCGKADGKSDVGFEGKGTGGGAGAGGKVRPVAVVAFTPDGVQVLSIPDKKGIVDKIFDRLPDVIELAKKAQEK